MSLSLLFDFVCVVGDVVKGGDALQYRALGEGDTTADAVAVLRDEVDVRRAFLVVGGVDDLLGVDA